MKKRSINIDLMKKYLTYDERTGIFNRRVSVSGKNGRAGSVAGTLTPSGYISISILGTSYSAHRLAWLYVNGEEPPEFIDHINGVRNDNRICNLRCATRSQNGMNRGIPINNTSGYKGVTWSKKSGKWNAYIRKDGKRMHLGYFDNIEDAAISARRARAIMHREYAKD